MTHYLVIGIYKDDKTRFAETYSTTTTDAAEKMAIKAHPNLEVAAVLEDNRKCECGRTTHIKIVA